MGRFDPSLFSKAVPQSPTAALAEPLAENRECRLGKFV
jgi:hypothetical protein